MHAHSLVWLALALFGAALVYRRLLGATWVAGLATLLYAVNDTHGPAVGWIANRNAVIAIALALPVLWLHDRWRRDGWTPGAWLAPLLLDDGAARGGVFAGDRRVPRRVRAARRSRPASRAHPVARPLRRRRPRVARGLLAHGLRDVGLGGVLRPRARSDRVPRRAAAPPPLAPPRAVRPAVVGLRGAVRVRLARARVEDDRVRGRRAGPPRVGVRAAPPA